MSKYVTIYVSILISVIIATELIAMGGPGEGGSKFLRGREWANDSPSWAPGDNWYHYNQGMINIKWKLWDEAQEEFDYYLRHPEMHANMFGVAHFGKGVMFQAMGNLEKALAQFKVAAANDLHPVAKVADQAYMNMGAIYLKQKAYPEAVNAYSKAVESSPKSGAAHYWLGMSYLRTGEIEKAEQEAGTAKQLGIHFTALYEELAEKKNPALRDAESSNAQPGQKRKKNKKEASSE